MPFEPETKRAVVFFDGQNLFHAAREVFGSRYPNYSPLALAAHVCKAKGWGLEEIRFYTGVPPVNHDPFWNHFWNAKMGAMGHRGIKVFSRLLRYREKEVQCATCDEKSTSTVGQEKGIDVRIALDVIRMAREKLLDIALMFSQDQDFTEVVDEVEALAQEQGRSIKMACAFPWSDIAENKRGIDKTDWIQIDKATYDACIDSRDYRPKRSLQP